MRENALKMIVTPSTVLIFSLDFPAKVIFVYTTPLLMTIPGRRYLIFVCWEKYSMLSKTLNLRRHVVCIYATTLCSLPAYQEFVTRPILPLGKLSLNFATLSV